MGLRKTSETRNRSEQGPCRALEDTSDPKKTNQHLCLFLALSYGDNKGDPKNQLVLFCQRAAHESDPRPEKLMEEMQQEVKTVCAQLLNPTDGGEPENMTVCVQSTVPGALHQPSGQAG